VRSGTGTVALFPFPAAPCPDSVAAVPVPARPGLSPVRPRRPPPTPGPSPTRAHPSTAAPVHERRGKIPEGKRPPRMEPPRVIGENRPGRRTCVQKNVGERSLDGGSGEGVAWRGNDSPLSKHGNQASCPFLFIYGADGCVVRNASPRDVGGVRRYAWDNSQYICFGLLFSRQSRVSKSKGARRFRGGSDCHCGGCLLWPLNFVHAVHTVVWVQGQDKAPATFARDRAGTDKAKSAGQVTSFTR